MENDIITYTPSFIEDLKQISILTPTLKNIFSNIYTTSVQQNNQTNQPKNKKNPSDYLYKTNKWKNKNRNKIELFQRNLNMCFNRISPENFVFICNKLMDINFTNYDMIDVFCQCLYNTMLTQHYYIPLYGIIIQCFGEKMDLVFNTQLNKLIDFRTIFLDYCQKNFELNLKTPLPNIDAIDYDEKKILKKGNILIISELYTQHLLSDNVIKMCISILLEDINEMKNKKFEDYFEKIEMGCLLLSKVGNQLNKNDSQFINNLLSLFKKIISTKIKQRISFLFMDIIDLQKNKWIIEDRQLINLKKLNIEKIKSKIHIGKNKELHINAIQDAEDEFTFNISDADINVVQDDIYQEDLPSQESVPDILVKPSENITTIQDEDITFKINNIIEKYYETNTTLPIIMNELKDVKGKQLNILVEKFILNTIEFKNDKIKSTFELLGLLFENKFLNIENLKDGLKNIIPQFDDIIIDVPIIQHYLIILFNSLINNKLIEKNNLIKWITGWKNIISSNIISKLI